MASGAARSGSPIDRNSTSSPRSAFSRARKCTCHFSAPRPARRSVMGAYRMGTLLEHGTPTCREREKGFGFCQSDVKVVATVEGTQMTPALPRVTYSNISADFTPLHDWLDQAMRAFRVDVLGRAWPNIVSGRQDVSGRAYEVFCPFDRELLVARLVEADKKVVEAAVESARAAFPGWSGLAYGGRIETMRRFARALEARKYQLGMAAMFEVGKSRLEASGEAEREVERVDWYEVQRERTR